MADKKAIARYFLEEAFSTGNLAPADEWIAPNWVNHDPGTPELPPGPEGFKLLVSGYRAAFPDLKVTLDDVIVEGDKVAGRWTASGANTGPLMGMPPTGKQATISGISILTFAGGQVAEQRTNWDTLGMLQQLGVIPTPGQ
jgi:predicted ester cyclase